MSEGGGVPEMLVPDVLVIGGGAWGTALAIQAQRTGARVRLWVRGGGKIEPAGLTLMAVPAQQVRAVAGLLPAAGRVLVCAKGMEVGSGALPLQMLAEVRPAVQGMVLSGPNFAHEVAAGKPAASVVAGADAASRTVAMAALGTASFRLYGNEDAVGVQVGGAAKNVVAIAAGAVMGAGLGENARAALVTRGLAELGRLAVALGGRAETIAGLSGTGDLMLTCTGVASRNYALGVAVGEGASVAQALERASGVVEGVASAGAIRIIAGRHGLDLPICAAVAGLVAREVELEQAIAAVLARPRRDE